MLRKQTSKTSFNMSSLQKNLSIFEITAVGSEERKTKWRAQKTVLETKKMVKKT